MGRLTRPQPQSPRAGSFLRRDRGRRPDSGRDGGAGGSAPLTEPLSVVAGKINFRPEQEPGQERGNAVQAGKQTYVIEQAATPTRRVSTTAAWNPVRGLEITHEVEHHDPPVGGTAQTEVIHQVPEARVPELIARLGAEISTVPALIAWASASSANAARLTTALAQMDPPTLVFSRQSHR